MNATRAEIIRLARSCVGTPFHHQGRLPGRGLDCGGLVVWIGRELGLLTHDILDYSRNPNVEEMRRVMFREFEPVHPPQPADLLWLRTGRPQHLAILTDTGTMIHALNTGRNGGAVVEHTFAPCWQRRLVQAFAFRGLD